MRASTKPGTVVPASDLQAEGGHDQPPRRPETGSGLSPDEIRQIILDILG